MSTRCNTLIHGRNTSDVVALYRHCDGYLSGAGVDAYKMMTDMFATNIVIKNSLTAEDVAQWFIKNGDGEYEKTTGIHADVEYIYDIYINSRDSDPKSKPFEIRAFTTRMSFGKGPATRDEDVTNQLADEWSKYLAKRCKTTASDDGDASDIYAKIGEAVDRIWKDGLRDQMIDAVMDVIEVSKED